MRRLIPMILLAATALALGQSSPPTPAPDAPHSPAAVESKRKYDLSIKLAREAFRKTAVAADQLYISDLTALMKATTDDRQSSLEEAKRIDAARIAAIDILKEHQQDTGESKKTAPTFSGKWKVSYANGVDRHYLIAPDGSVQYVQVDTGEKSNGKINSGVIHLENGQVERWTFAGDRVLVEHFNPATTFPDQRPLTLGVGVAEN